MALGPREVMRSEEVEGGLTGPANPIPDESLDCGCAQYPCPKLAKYATRKLFVGLLCWIGFIQASAQAYYVLTSSTIARRFQIHPNTIEWLTLASEGLIPFLLALPIAYWGDRIHRAAWTGALVLLQSVGFLFLIIPHFSYPSTRVIEETSNVTTHLSLFSDDSPELCSKGGLARLINLETEQPYFTIGILVLWHIVNCMGNIAYFALGISYLDDNTRKRHVAIPMAIMLGLRFLGLLFGYLLAWGCLRLDAEKLTVGVQSYREQNGAWWLGWPILAILLAIPGLPMSWLPRRLPSEVVEQAAASILDVAGRTSPLSESTISDTAKDVGDPGYFSSMLRLITNKILMSNIFACVFCILALINYANNEDIIFESRFHAPRPSGMFLGYGDPLTSRIVTTLLRPILIGASIIMSGLAITTFRPRAKWLVSYNIAVGIIAAALFFSLAFVTCTKPTIVSTSPSNAMSLMRYCNKDCRCSRDANFQPVCNTEGSLTFYTPCHAGCTGIKNTNDGKIFTGCSCIEEITGFIDNEGRGGPCVSTRCQIGWIFFEVSTTLAYSLMASAAVGSLLIGLRSTNMQDKSLAIGLWIALTALFVYLPGKLLYWQIADQTCLYRGTSPSLCHLYDPVDLGAYLAFVTAFFLILGVLFELVIFFLCHELRIYREVDIEMSEIGERRDQVIPLMSEAVGPSRPDSLPATTIMTTLTTDVTSDMSSPEHNPISTSEVLQTSSNPVESNIPLKFGPLGPGNPRITSTKIPRQSKRISYSDDSEEEFNTDKRAPISLMTISYRRLEMDSDAETTDSSPVSHRRIDLIQRSTAEESPRIPPDHYGSSTLSSANQTVAGFAKTNDIEFTKWEKKKKDRPYTGDFNEVGIPILDYQLSSMNSQSIGSMSPKLLDDERRYQLEKANPVLDKNHHEADRPVSPVGHASSGFGSFASDLHKMAADSKAPTPVPENSESEGSSTKSTSRSAYRAKLPALATAL